MEKKKMTKEEAFEYLKNRKIYVNGKSTEIQKKLFACGVQWKSGGTNICDYGNYYVINSHGLLTHCDGMRSYWECLINEEISAEEILAIEIQEEKPKYEEELAKMAQPIRDYMRKHNISGRLVVCQSSIAVEDMRFIYPQ